MVLSELYRQCGNPADVLEYYAILNGYLLSFIKLVCLRLHLKRVLHIYSQAWNDWLNITDSNFTYIMKVHAEAGKKGLPSSNGNSLFDSCSIHI